jgi:hypothetical protein
MITEFYPCKRGYKYSLGAGYHHFQATEYGIVCIYCGERAPEPPVTVTYSNRVEGQCTICGGFHALGDEDAHPSYSGSD